MRKRTTRAIVGIAALAFTLAALAATGIYATYLYHKADRVIARIAAPETSVQPDANTAAGTDDFATAEPDADDPLRPQLFLLAGVDNRSGSGGTMNTDVLLLIAFNPHNRSASMLSLPRDLRVVSAAGTAHKANYYYANFYIRDKETAIAQTKRFFGERFGLRIDHMAVVNFDALRQIVDSLGGLEIDVDMDMRYRDRADGTDINLKSGLQKLNGQQTLDFVRYRKSNMGTAESSDFARNERQQVVLKRIVDKLGTLGGIAQWGNVLDILGDNVRTDIPEPNLRSWIAQFQHIRPTQIRSVPLQAEWVSPFVYAGDEDLEQAIDALRRELAGTSS